MTQNRSNDEPNLDEFDDIELPDDLASILGSDDTWAPVDPDLESSIVAAVMAEIDAAPVEGAVMAEIDESSVEGAALTDSPPAATPPAGPRRADVVPFPSRWKSAALGAAAALLLVAGIFGALQLGGSDADLELAMAGTELAPDASAVAEITDTPAGTRIIITVDDLPPAPPGTYYQAWLRKDAEVGVSAGTFHLRTNDGPIELWAGVSTDDYPLLTVTLQQEAQTESSGQVVLRAVIGDP